MAFRELGQLAEVEGHSTQLAQPDMKAGPKALSQEGLIMGGARVSCVPCSPPLPAAICATGEFSSQVSKALAGAASHKWLVLVLEFWGTLLRAEFLKALDGETKISRRGAASLEIKEWVGWAALF